MCVGSNIAYAQITVGTTPTLLAAARPGRKNIKIFAGNSVMYIGDSSVTTTTGFAREGTDNYNLSLDYDGALYAVMASGSGTASVIETY